jgi:hypothetical protein
MGISRATIIIALAPLACGTDGTTKIEAGVAGPDSGDALPAQPDATFDLSWPVTLSTWPGNSTVTVVSNKDTFGANLSGLAYEPASQAASAILWAVQNEPPKLYRLTWNGSAYVPVTSDGWTTGKSLHYPNGKGGPDGEGATRTEWTNPEIYVVAERDNDAKEISRQSILRYDLGGTKGVMDATHEWNLTTDLPTAEPNNGLEGIAWISDSYLVDRGFFDENRQSAYDPAAYPNHGTGIFLVGYDVLGMIYGYVLDHAAGTYARVTSFSSGQVGSMDLSFDRDHGTLWSLCDNACNSRMTLLDIDSDPGSASRGRFVLRATVPPPKPLKDLNSEGLALAPETECIDDQRAVFWSDDDESGGYSIRRAAVTCGRLY